MKYISILLIFATLVAVSTKAFAETFVVYVDRAEQLELMIKEFCARDMMSQTQCEVWLEHLAQIKRDFDLMELTMYGSPPLELND